ncbi:hypothetical protein ACE6H2_018967 [Prunus campanulata]
MTEGSVRLAVAMDVHSLNAKGKDVLEETSLSQDAASKNQLMAYKSPKKRTLEEVEEHEEESNPTSFLYMFCYFINLKFSKLISECKLTHTHTHKGP